MADSLNPFFGEDSVEDELDGGVEKLQISEPTSNHVAVESIANFLIKENLLLSALELHTELIERGRELPNLRDFFSNPGNFERTRQIPDPTPGLRRTPSCQTFDSLDWARYSDDGDRQEDRVAVLEFELRKAQETIKSLRANLTVVTENESSAPERKSEEEKPTCVDIKPHEMRALNFLINEYLLVHNYKLTAVTFSEENEDQDFDDWDDVGLNIPKPPDLFHLYRDYGNHMIPTKEVRDISCGVDFDTAVLHKVEREFEETKKDLEEQIDAMDTLIARLNGENRLLHEQIQEMESELEMVKKKTSTPFITPVSTPMKQQIRDISRIQNSENSESDKDSVKRVDLVDGDEQQAHEIAEVKPQTDSENTELSLPYGEDVDQVNSVTGECSDNVGQNLTVTTSDSNVQQNHESITCQPCNRNMSDTFKDALMKLAFQVSEDNRIASEVLKITDSQIENVVTMLARCLPHIVPNVLLAKREELIPLILCAASLHPDLKERDNLLNILFNLIKRPDHEQRQMILTGCVVFAQCVGPTRVESELLPQCWEQLAHKFPERRQLVAEACGALAPYMQSEMRSSLVLSMLQQMLDDKSEDVRAAVVKSLGLLVGFIDDENKFGQIRDLLVSCLGDSSSQVTSAATDVLLPSFSLWSKELGRLETDLIQLVLDKLRICLQNFDLSVNVSNVNTTDEQSFCLWTGVLKRVVPLLFLSSLETSPYGDKLELVDSNCDWLSSRLPVPMSSLTSVEVIIGDRNKLSCLVREFDSYMEEDIPVMDSWEGLSFIVNQFVSSLINICCDLSVQMFKLVPEMVRVLSCFSQHFGRPFIMNKVRCKFETAVELLETDLNSTDLPSHPVVASCLLPVYTSGILAAFSEEDDRKLLSTFLSHHLCTLSLSHVPLNSLQLTFTELCSDQNNDELLLAVLWDGVVHKSAEVRSSAAIMFELLVKGVSDSLVSTRIVPALVTLASDPEISVRTSTIPAFGTIMEFVTNRDILDKVYMQFQTFMDDPIYLNQHDLTIQLIKTFARAGPNTEPKFRDEIILPRLAIIAATNNHCDNETKKQDVALHLFEAYSALSCCFVSQRLIKESMLPGLHCLRQDLHLVAHEHEEVVASLIKEMEIKSDSARQPDSFSTAPVAAAGNADDVKSKMMKGFKDLKDKSSSSRTNIANIFSWKNKGNQ